MLEADVEAIISCERNTPFYNGYRPSHLIKDDYLTTGVHHYYGKESLCFGESCLGSITFITPEAYPSCLWEGKKITIQEGSRIVGYAIITKIYNETLIFVISIYSIEELPSGGSANLLRIGFIGRKIRNFFDIPFYPIKNFINRL